MTSRPLFSRRELLFRRLVLIYQMPKVGSQTIEASLRQAGFPYPIYRFHYLSTTQAKTIKRGVVSSTPASAWKDAAQNQLESARVLSRTLRLRRRLCLCGLKIPALEIITGVRELIGLMLASIFENYLYFAPSVEEMTVEKCAEALLHPKTFKTIRDWFDLELKSFLGIDVYETAFPRPQGYAIYQNRFARLLVYRFEALDCLPEVLSDFLEHKIPALVNCNVGESKQYADQYRFVKEHLCLPFEFVTELYGCQMMQHFYSDLERSKWLTRWTGRPLSRDVQNALIKAPADSGRPHMCPETQKW